MRRSARFFLLHYVVTYNHKFFHLLFQCFDNFMIILFTPFFQINSEFEVCTTLSHRALYNLTQDEKWYFVTNKFVFYVALFLGAQIKLDCVLKAYVINWSNMKMWPKRPRKLSQASALVRK